MWKLAAPASVLALLGLGQSVSGWESPLIGAALMALAAVLGTVALVAWMRPRSPLVDRCCTYFGITPSSDAPALVPDEHRDELRAVVRNAVTQLDHPAPVFWPVDNPRLKAAASAHFPDLTVLVREYSAAERKLHAAHGALTARITAECESRGITESEPLLKAHADLYSPLLAVAEDRMPVERYSAEWEDTGGMPDLPFADAVAWEEIPAIRAAYDAERALRLQAFERARDVAARERIATVSDCPTCMLNAHAPRQP